MPRQSATVMRQMEIRVGPQFGPPHADGRRGIVSVSGPVPDEMSGWLRYKDATEGLTVHPLPPGYGTVWIYIGNELVVEPEAPDGSDAGASEAHELLTSIDALGAEAGRRNVLIDKLDARLAVLREHVAMEEAKLKRSQQEVSELQPRLEAERARNALEIKRLDEELAAYRRECLAAKVAQLHEVKHAGEMFGQAVDQITTRLLAQVDDVATRTTGQIKVITDLTETILKSEAAAAKDAEARKLEAQVQTTSTLSMMQDLEAGGVKALVGPTAPPPPSGWMGVGNGVGGWIEKGGLDKLLDFGEKIFERAYPQKPQP